MSKNKPRLILPVVMFLLAAVAGYALYQVNQKSKVADTPVVVNTEKPVKPVAKSVVALLGTRRPDTVLPDLEGQARDISDWEGKVVLVNFWATWCPPCRREIPEFIEVRDKYKDQGFEILGIAIDTADVVKEFVRTMGIDYPIVHGEMDAVTISSAYGNTMGGLPYSVLLDRDGNIQFVRTGELSKDMLEEQLKLLL